MIEFHRSVMPNEVIEFIKLNSNGTYLDCTLGEGGHTDLFLESGVKKVVAVDRDPQAISIYKEKGKFKEDPRLELVQSRFSEIGGRFSPNTFDGILVDLGVSTRQLLVGERGFSFQSPGPLDMRMNSQDMRSLEYVLSHTNAVDLARQLEAAVDMKRPLDVAKKLIDAMSAGKLQTTQDLANLSNEARIGGKHPATVLFLALRMIVNDELGEIERGFPRLLDLLKPMGRLVVITFHSTEDRLVKVIFKKFAGKCVCDLPRDLCRCEKTPRAELITKKPIDPKYQEIRANRRARSAKLRCVERL